MKISPFSEFLLQTLILTDFHYFARRLWDSWESSRSIWIVTLKLSKGPWDPAKPSALQIKTVGHTYFDIKEYKVKSENSPKISIFQIFGHHDMKLGMWKLGPYKFIFRFGTAKRKPQMRKLWEKYGWAKRIYRFQAIRAWTPRFYKTIVAMNWPNHPGDGITLQA